MGQSVRRAVARPRLGVDPFETRSRPQWLVAVLEEQAAEKAVRAQRAIARKYAEQKASPFEHWSLF